LTKVDETRQAVPALDTAAVGRAAELLCKQVAAWAEAFSVALRPLGAAMAQAMSDAMVLAVEPTGPRADHGDPCGEPHPPVGARWPR
jgi:hypothetical protein